MSAAFQLTDADLAELRQLEAQFELDREQLWAAGDLAWKLDQHQAEVYTKYRAWEAIPLSKAENDNAQLARGMRRIFVLDVGRRWGKTFLTLLIAMENCLRRPGCRATYATALRDDIAGIILPLFEQIAADAPEHVRPVYRRSAKGLRQHIRFANGSILLLVGIDKNPNNLRGQYSDFFAVTEAGYVKGLGDTVASKVYAQFQRRPWARMILESSAPEEIDHDFDTKFVPDAIKRSAYHFATVDDNTAISREEIEEQVEGVAAIDPYKAQREFYGVRVRNPDLYLVPEFSLQKHVRALKRAELAYHARAFTAMDPGFRDMCGILFAYWDYKRAVLRIVGEWSQRGAGTPDIADAVREAEYRLWRTMHRKPGQDSWEHPEHSDNEQRQPAGLLWKVPREALTWWDGEQLRPNPVARWMDVHPLLADDLAREHGLVWNLTEKPVGAMEADINSIRTALKREQIEIDPSCTKLAACLHSARWNKNRTDWERTKEHGHFDLLATLVYLWRNFERGEDPTPPKYHDRRDISVQDSVLAPRRDGTFDRQQAEQLWAPEREWKEERSQWTS